MWGRVSFEHTPARTGELAAEKLTGALMGRTGHVGPRYRLRNAGPFNTNTALSADVFAEAYGDRISDSVQVLFQRCFAWESRRLERLQ